MPNLMRPKQARIAAGLTLREFAQRASLTVIRASDIDRGVVQPTEEERAAIEGVHGCPLDWTLTEQEEQHNDVMSKTLEMMKAAKIHWRKHGRAEDTMPCLCGGILSYRVSSWNNHMHAKCDTCSIGWCITFLDGVKEGANATP